MSTSSTKKIMIRPIFHGNNEYQRSTRRRRRRRLTVATIIVIVDLLLIASNHGSGCPIPSTWCLFCHAWSGSKMIMTPLIQNASEKNISRRSRGRKTIPILSMMSSNNDEYKSIPNTLNNPNRNPNLRIPRDIVIIGGGLAGLSIAHYIASSSQSQQKQHHSPPRHITILEREDSHQRSSQKKTVVGSFAAAGMLAPQSERLPAGPLLNICLESREMYGNWIQGIERNAREAALGVGGVRGKNKGGGRGGGGSYTGVGAQYLWKLVDEDGILSSFDGGPSPPLEPWETGFHCTGGFLAPAFAGDAVATWSPQPHSGQAYWLDDIQVRELEPQLHPSVIGGWWFPEDASVDARRLTCALRAACAGLGVQMNFGPEYEVKSLEMGRLQHHDSPATTATSTTTRYSSDGNNNMEEEQQQQQQPLNHRPSTNTPMAVVSTCRGVHLANGQIYAPKSVIVANGSWMRNLLPLPVVPHKGQSLSLRMPSSSPPLLSRVLFAQDTYIVPKADGRIIVGATVEPGKFDGDITPSGMMHCLSEATRLVPALQDLPIEECWAGLRPTTPDKCPILGGTEQWNNVYLAGGYWRNGVLLAPKTGQLVGELVMNDGSVEKLAKEDRELLKAFSWERFTTPGGGKALAANARYAATFYPVHKRSTTGVASSVGTELGFYEGASAAKGDRARDRDALLHGAFGGGGVGDSGVSDQLFGEEVLEHAARMGVDDARAFSLGNDDNDDDGRVLRRNKLRKEVTSGQAIDIVEEGVTIAKTTTVESDHPDALTVGVIEDADVETREVDITSNLSYMYEKIKANKSKVSETLEMMDTISEERADPGFRIYHVDSVTNEILEVPPYTSPGEFLQMKAEGKLLNQSSDGIGKSQSILGEQSVTREAYGEGVTAEETANTTRRARMSNRSKSSEIDESKIGAMAMSAPPSSTSKNIYSGDLSLKYNNETNASHSLANGNNNYKLCVEESEAVDDQIIGAFSLSSEHIDDGSDEETYDGYQAIQQANSASTRKEELELMKEARQANRAKSKL